MKSYSVLFLLFTLIFACIYAYVAGYYIQHTEYFRSHISEGFAVMIFYALLTLFSYHYWYKYDRREDEHEQQRTTR